MSRKAVRTAVATWFAPPNVAGLYKVYTGEPRDVPTSDYTAGAPAGTQSGAIAFPFIEAQNERREALGGATSGWKFVTYEVAFVVKFYSIQRVSQLAYDDHDALIDSIVTRLRSDRTLGGTVWQAGEGDTVNGVDIHILSDLLKTRQNAGPLLGTTVVRFTAIEAAQT